MALHSAIFFGVLLAACFYAILRGGGPERAVAAIMVCGVVATRVTNSALPLRYRSLEWPMLVVDIAVLIGFLAVALKADRRWPQAVTTIHTLSVGAHLVKALNPELIRTVYWMMTNLWVYPQLALLIMGTLRHQRRLRRNGADPSWSSYSTR